MKTLKMSGGQGRIQNADDEVETKGQSSLNKLS